ncbi:hypothetical protein BDK51DRAFT_32449 [Blyttiomyces helicus]|uniref:Uncharacterized protein n=1 Tax=Blyttiomyces helicus TaxID=388810 RepID=A0A4V1IPY2_9FUNG|nr:hypothetical protein BDK51DRAFT_32449 [Blyttiomyces helicus]|eukprot:RKO84647.1 hypothetical protein BDK51DRAFT_32449 [Blyttiomyces helicus]
MSSGAPPPPPPPPSVRASAVPVLSPAPSRSLPRGNVPRRSSPLLGRSPSPGALAGEKLPVTVVEDAVGNRGIVHGKTMVQPPARKASRTDSIVGISSLIAAKGGAQLGPAGNKDLILFITTAPGTTGLERSATSPVSTRRTIGPGGRVHRSSTVGERPASAIGVGDGRTRRVRAGSPLSEPPVTVTAPAAVRTPVPAESLLATSPASVAAVASPAAPSQPPAAPSNSESPSTAAHLQPLRPSPSASPVLLTRSPSHRTASPIASAVVPRGGGDQSAPRAESGEPHTRAPPLPPPPRVRSIGSEHQRLRITHERTHDLSSSESEAPNSPLEPSTPTSALGFYAPIASPLPAPAVAIATALPSRLDLDFPNGLPSEVDDDDDDDEASGDEGHPIAELDGMTGRMTTPDLEAHRTSLALSIDPATPLGLFDGLASTYDLPPIGLELTLPRRPPADYTRSEGSSPDQCAAKDAEKEEEQEVDTADEEAVITPRPFAPLFAPYRGDMRVDASQAMHSPLDDDPHVLPVPAAIPHSFPPRTYGPVSDAHPRRSHPVDDDFVLPPTVGRPPARDEMDSVVYSGYLEKLSRHNKFQRR